MAETNIARRKTALDDAPLVFGAAASPAFVMQAAPVAFRFLLRMKSPPALVAGFGLSMPLNRMTKNGALLAIRPGPDEFWLIAPEGTLTAAQIEADLGGDWHALVDISHRNAGLDVSGTAVCDVLNAGCALDLHPGAFPVGMATRTLLGKAEVLLLRLDETRFRLECGRSFAPYVRDFLAEAAREWGRV